MGGLLFDVELFMFTDHSTAEAVFYKGTCSSPQLFELVLRLQQIQMSGALTLHVIHVASTRMIAEGTDGLFHGNLTEGVMKGASMLCFVPLHLSALERSPQLKTWVKDLFGSEESTWLTPLGWHDEGQKQNQCIWVHPPVVANVAVELLAKSKHKRPDNVLALPFH